MISLPNTAVVSDLATVAIMDTIICKTIANSCNLCIKVITLKAEPKSLQQSREIINYMIMKTLCVSQMEQISCGMDCNFSENQQEIIDVASLVCAVGSLFGPIGAALFAGPGICLAIVAVVCE